MKQRLLPGDLVYWDDDAGGLSMGLTLGLIVGVSTSPDESYPVKVMWITRRGKLWFDGHPHHVLSRAE